MTQFDRFIYEYKQFPNITVQYPCKHKGTGTNIYFSYLEATITEDGKCASEISSRLEKAKVAFLNLLKIITKNRL